MAAPPGFGRQRWSVPPGPIVPAPADFRIPAAARRQAALAAKAAKAMRSQMQEQAGAPAASSSTPAKTPDGGHDPGDWK
jgi:hypothetical protein